jgi:hypothetical protein
MEEAQAAIKLAQSPEHREQQRVDSIGKDRRKIELLNARLEKQQQQGGGGEEGKDG